VHAWKLTLRHLLQFVKTFALSQCTQSRIALRADRVPVFATVLFAEFFLVGDFIAKDGYYK